MSTMLYPNFEDYCKRYGYECTRPTQFTQDLVNILRLKSGFSCSVKRKNHGLVLTNVVIRTYTSLDDTARCDQNNSNDPPSDAAEADDEDEQHSD